MNVSLHRVADNHPFQPEIPSYYKTNIKSASYYEYKLDLHMTQHIFTTILPLLATYVVCNFMSA
jgi:hypothetical protein